MATVYLGLGANLGDRLHNLRQALSMLGEKAHVECVSSVYETEPVGYADQPLFLNAVCRATTALRPRQLLKFVKAIEKKLGRTAGFRNAPRPADIDILYYDDEILHVKELTIPHPRLKERAFVLVPLAEIAADIVDPETGVSVRDMKEALGEYKGVSLWGGAEKLSLREQKCIT